MLTFGTQTNLGDVIIIWRAYVLWSLDLEKGCTRVIILPIAILFGSFGMSFTRFRDYSLLTILSSHVCPDILLRRRACAILRPR